MIQDDHNDDMYPNWYNELDRVRLEGFMDMVAIVTPKVRTWSLQGQAFDNEREAKLLAGRLLIYYSGVRVVKQVDKYFVLHWSDKEPIIQ